MRSQQFLSRMAEVSLQRSTDRKIAPYYPSSAEVVSRMLDLAGVGSEDVVYDIGSGDGRILIQACNRGAKRAVGIEIEPTLVKASKENIQQDPMSKDRAIIIESDFANVDLSDATVIIVYMGATGTSNTQKYLRSLPHVVRIISHDYPFEGWTPTETYHGTHIEPSPDGAVTQHIGSYTLFRYSTSNLQ